MPHQSSLSSEVPPGIPFPAHLLGCAGVVPFVGLAIVQMVSEPAMAIWAGGALRAYGVAILAFMGGVQWGLEMARGIAPERSASGYGASVLPALIGFFALLVPLALGLSMLAGAFAVLLGYDLDRIRRGVGPLWYASLRRQLSAAVIPTLIIAAFVAGRDGIGA